jgi:hypothetical protein
MKLLHAIYSSPIDLLAKAEEDGNKLINAVRNQNKAQARAALFDFAVTVYHVWDWIKASRPELSRKAPHPLTTYQSLAACRDLANASKHAVIKVTRGPYKKYPPVVQSVAVSVLASMPNQPMTASGHQSQMPSWRFKVQLPGRRVPIEDLVAEAISAWKSYFAKNCIT